MILKYLLIFGLVLVLTQQQCQPLYWEVNNTYVLEGKQLHYLEKAGIHPPVFKSKKGDYIISDINGSVIYDSQSQNSRIQGSTYRVENAILNVLFTFKAVHDTKKGYDGIGTVSLKGITVNYTKTPTIVNFTAGFEISNVSSAVPAIGAATYNPSTSQSAQFNKLVQGNLSEWVQSYFKSNLKQVLSDAANSPEYGIRPPFNSNPYNYTYNTIFPKTALTVSINMNVLQKQFFDKGYMIGYSGSIKNQQKCGKYIPTDFQKHSSFFTLELIDSIYNEFVKGFNDWKTIVVNSGNAKSSYFGWKIIDIQSIMPNVTNSYTNLLDSIEARCTIDKDLDSQIYLNNASNTIQLQAGFTCNLSKVQASDPIVTFYVINKYSLSVNQTGTQLNIRIESASPKSANWQQGEFPIVNEGLASMYLSIIVATLNQQYTLGTGFSQPSRQYAKVTVLPEAVQVFDAAYQSEQIQIQI